MPPTNSERIEAVEKITKDLQTTVEGLGASMSSVEHALADHTSHFAAIMAKLDKLASNLSTPGHGDSSDALGGNKPLSDASSSTALLPRMDLPGFDGADPIAWLAQAEQYFLVHQTPVERRVQTALIVMSGKAMFWAQWLLRRASSIQWADFSRELIARFGDSSAVNAYEALHLTRQIGSLEDYLSLFEERVAQLPSLPPEQYLGIFLGGLHPDIRDCLPDSELTDVFAAIRAARRIAWVTKSPNGLPCASFTSSHASCSTTTFSHPLPMPGKSSNSPQSVHHTSFQDSKSRHLTPAQ